MQPKTLRRIIHLQLAAGFNTLTVTSLSPSNNSRLLIGLFSCSKKSLKLEQSDAMLRYQFSQISGRVLELLSVVAAGVN